MTIATQVNSHDITANPIYIMFFLWETLLRFHITFKIIDNFWQI